jgi:hypothetical protein
MPANIGFNRPLDINSTLAYTEDMARASLPPGDEAWLFKNPRALASVRRGLKDAAEGKVSKMPSLAKYACESLQ